MSRTKRSIELAKHLWSYKRSYSGDFKASCITDCYFDPGDMLGYKPKSRHLSCNLRNAWDDEAPAGKVKYSSQWK